MGTLPFVLAFRREEARVGLSIFHVRSAVCSLPCDYLVVELLANDLYTLTLLRRCNYS